MLPWQERTFEIAYLLNPAFCGILIRESGRGYEEEKGQGLPFVLSFLVLPIILHQGSREKLPDRVNLKMSDWLERNPQARNSFANRAQHLVPYTREALTFGLQKGLISITENGGLMPATVSTLPLTWPSASEPIICAQKALFLGRWFANSESVSSIFRLWGIRP